MTLLPSKNQPASDPSQEGSTRSSTLAEFPSWEGSGVGFMVPMRSKNGVEALREN
jgi:hypothetical protein